MNAHDDIDRCIWEGTCCASRTTWMSECSVDSSYRKRHTGYANRDGVAGSGEYCRRVEWQGCNYTCKLIHYKGSIMSTLHEELCYTSAVDLAEQIRAKEISPVELMDAFIERVEAINPKLSRKDIGEQKCASHPGAVLKKAVLHSLVRATIVGRLKPCSSYPLPGGPTISPNDLRGSRGALGWGTSVFASPDFFHIASQSQSLPGSKVGKIFVHSLCWSISIRAHLKINYNIYN